MTNSPAIEPLDAERIRAALPDGVELPSLSVHDSVDSTNTWLAERADLLPSPTVCLSEHQRAGRGRRGRVWVDHGGRDLCLSVLWKFDAASSPRPQGLSLASGVAVARAIAAFGAGEFGLKWPNDIIAMDRKLGGILIEGSVSATKWTAIIGIGINVHAGLAPDVAADPAVMPPVALADLMPEQERGEAGAGPLLSRNRLAAHIIAEVSAECARFEAHGPAPAIRDWRRLDTMSGRRVEVTAPGRTVTGIARGVDEAGELLVEVSGVIERFVSAEISLRAAPTHAEDASA